MESTGKALTTGVTMPVIALGATSVKEFGSVDKSMKLVQATMGSTDAQAKQLESTMKKQRQIPYSECRTQQTQR